MATRDIILIGGSAGSFSPLREILGCLPADLPAAVLVVIHTGSGSPRLLDRVLERDTALTVSYAESEQALQLGHVFVAPPDLHLLLTAEGIRTRKGPKENRTRPAIDPLFRTAAVNCQARVLAVLLSGYMNDGASGISAVRRCGGLAIIQDPEDATVDEMPRRALETAGADYTLPSRDIGPLLLRLAGEPAPVPVAVPEQLRLEASISERGMSNEQQQEKLGTLAPYICPDCSGPVWEMKVDNVLRYRCHIGHAFTAEHLMEGQEGEVERALSAALRALRERSSLLGTMAADQIAAGREKSGLALQDQAREAHHNADVIRALLGETG